MEFKKLSDVVNTEDIKETIDWLSGMYVVNKEFMDMTMKVIEKQSKKIKEQGDVIIKLQNQLDYYKHTKGYY